MTKTPSKQFNTCRKLVFDDALKARLAAEMATPLLGGELTKIKGHYPVGIFLRRSLTRYLSLVLSRLLDKLEEGRTGITASIASLLEMAHNERILSGIKIQRFVSDFDKIKTHAAQGQYDLVSALRGLRNIHLAHKLIPWENPSNDVLGHDLIEFAEAIFKFVTRLNQAIATTTSNSLSDARKAANDFQRNVDTFFEALRDDPPDKQ